MGKTDDKATGVEDITLKDKLEQENAEGVTSYKNQKYQEALGHFQNGLAHSLVLYPEKPHTTVATCHHNLASTYMKLGDVNNSKAQTFSELSVYAKIAGDFSRRKKYDKAISYLKKCIPLAEKIRPQYNRENLIRIHTYLSEMYQLRNADASDQQKAQEHLEKVQEIQSVPDTSLADAFAANHNKMVDNIEAMIASDPNYREAVNRVFGQGGLFRMSTSK